MSTRTKRTPAKRTRPAIAKPARPGLGAQILDGLRDAVAYERGELALPPGGVRRVSITARRATATPAPRIDADFVVRVRRRLELSQPVFAAALNVSRETVRAWEQGKRRPDGAAARLLEIADRHPDVILSTVCERKR